MDPIDDLTDEHLKEFFLEDLNCINDLTAFRYPNYLYDDHSFIEDHIRRCQNILRNYMISQHSDFEIEDQELLSIIDEKFEEIMKLCENEIQALSVKADFKTVYIKDNQD
ncbi:hypothetical protein [Flavobacterium sp. GSB-24]|uniref:hypothetical protein n=1 Tax=Flavobacterium sp. GSB-24 TaxID=2994319 RepID=UPI00248FD15F|nr:hypothetical protein [Flavobacterium sp. GSB-24]BDU27712.1 hypothetical protein FLGSB24_44560 [Flavobacterium sp. GSB-24]